MKDKPIDFDITSEPWNKYEISKDQSILKTRYILKTVHRRMVDNKARYTGDGQLISVIMVPDKLRGTPDKRIYPPEQLVKAVVEDDMRYKTLSEEWNEYELHDGARIRLKATVTTISKTSKRDVNGDPIYSIGNNVMIQVKAPKTSG